MTRIVIVFLISLAAAAAATPAAIKIAPRIGAMDVPTDGRRMHDDTVPRFGGIALFCGILAGFAALTPLSAQLKGILAGSAFILLVGIADDIRGLPARLKLLLQLAAALIPCFCGLRFTGFSFTQGGAYHALPEVLSFVITLFWIVGITNTINLVDGLDGLAAGITFIASVSIAYTAYVGGATETVMMTAAIAGSSLGFLFYNFNPAKVFMGDGGSMLLGFLLSSVSLLGISPSKKTALFSLVVPVVVFGLPIFDTAFAIIRRAINHKPIMQADKGHLHHRIMDLGFSHRATVLILYCVSAVMGAAGIFWTKGRPALSAVLLACALLFILFLLLVGGKDKEEGGK